MTKKTTPDLLSDVDRAAMVASALESVQRQRVSVDLQRITTGAQPTDAFSTAYAEDGTPTVTTYEEALKSIDKREEEIARSYSTDLPAVERFVADRERARGVS